MRIGIDAALDKCVRGSEQQKRDNSFLSGDFRENFALEFRLGEGQNVS